MVFCWGAQNVSYLRRFFCVFYAVFTHRSGIQFAFQRAQDHNIPSTGSKVPWSTPPHHLPYLGTIPSSIVDAFLHRVLCCLLSWSRVSRGYQYTKIQKDPSTGKNATLPSAGPYCPSSLRTSPASPGLVSCRFGVRFFLIGAYCRLVYLCQRGWKSAHRNICCTSISCASELSRELSARTRRVLNTYWAHCMCPQWVDK